MSHSLKALLALLFTYATILAQAADTGTASGDTVASRAPIDSTAEKTEKGILYDLGKVTVTAGARKFARKETDHVARMPLANLENPQSYTVVPKELTEEQMAVDYRSAFKNVPGAGSGSTAINGRSLFPSRGFTVENLIRNGVAGFVFADIDPANLERIEAIRGPSATLFGAVNWASYGGVFNRVTKKPFGAYKGEVSYSGGNWNLSRLTADVNTPLNGEKTALLRVNAAIDRNQSFQDAGNSKSWMFAPSFSYQVNDRLSILLDAEFYDREGTGKFAFFPFGLETIKSADELNIDSRRSFNHNSITVKTPTQLFNGRTDYRISDQWSSQTIYAHGRSELDLPGIFLFSTSDSTLRRQVNQQYSGNYTHQVQQNLLGDVTLWTLRNRLLLGLDYYNFNSDLSIARLFFDTLNFVNPGPGYGELDVDAVKARLASQSYNVTKGEQHVYSAYISDVIDLPGRTSIMLGLRVDKYDNRGSLNVKTGVTSGIYEQIAVSPKFGLVYQPVKDQISLFANFMNGFRNQFGTDAEGNVFSPEQAYQTEGGIKAETFGGRLVGTLSYYEIRVNDVIRTDPADPGFSVQDGEQTSRGAELELTANPVPGLNIVGGYAYNRSELVKADPEVNGRRPGYSGPEQAANFWASYRLVDGSAKGLGLGFGGNYAGEQLLINTAEYRFSLPEFMVWDAALFYDQPSYRLGLKLDNITSEKYWTVEVAPQSSRRFIGSATYKF